MYRDPPPAPALTLADATTPEGTATGAGHAPARLTAFLLAGLRLPGNHDSKTFKELSFTETSELPDTVPPFPCERARGALPTALHGKCSYQNHFTDKAAGA